jgi:hypothetical protein
MTLLLIAALLVFVVGPVAVKAVVAGAVAVCAWRVLARSTAVPAPGEPGASALARARELRTPLVRLAGALSIPTRAGAEAARYEAGGRTEQYVASLLAELQGEGWRFLYDRRLPSGSTNVDGLALSPRGHVYVLDPKRMSDRFPVTVQAGRLLHGTHDVTGRLDGLMRGARAVHSLLSVQPVPVAVVHGRLPAGREYRLAGARIVAAATVCEALRRMDAARTARRHPPNFFDIAARSLPPYTGDTR